MTNRSSSLYWRWVLFCTVGELIGFGGIPVLGGAVALWLTAELPSVSQSLILYAVAVVGGLGEGAVLAWFQLRVLQKLLVGLDARRWVLATGLAASVAWMLGMLVPTLDDVFEISPATQIAVWIPASLAILLSIGAAQAWVLRGIVEQPQRWLIANVLGWLLGLPWTFALPALLSESASIIVWVITFIIAGVLMGLTVGLVTGFTLVRLVPIRPS